MDVVFVLNNEITQGQIDQIKRFDPSYEPRKNNTYNRTVIHVPTGTCVQIEINTNLCEIVIKYNFDQFKAYLLRPIINFLISSVKNTSPAKVINEIGYKLNFYVPAGTPFSEDSWWSGSFTEKEMWIKSQQPSSMTNTGLNIPPHTKVTYFINVDENYLPIKETQCSRCNSTVTPKGGLFSVPTGPSFSSFSTTQQNSYQNPMSPWNQASTSCSAQGGVQPVPSPWNQASGAYSGGWSAGQVPTSQFSNSNPNGTSFYEDTAAKVMFGQVPGLIPSRWK